MPANKRFSSFLITVVVAMVTASTLLISSVFYFYFNKRTNMEFANKLLAQKGRVELFLQNRLDQVQNRLKDLSRDNAVRVTMMLGVTPQLEERLTTVYPPAGGLRFFVRNGNQRLIPTPPGSLPAGLTKALSTGAPVNGMILDEQGDPGLFWVFPAPITRRTEKIGTALAVYNLAKDQQVLDDLRQQADVDLAIPSGHGLMRLSTGTRLSPSVSEATFPGKMGKDGFMTVDDSLKITPLKNFKDLYFLASQKDFLREKRAIALLIAFLATVVILVAAILGVFLAKQMAKPLRELADKASQISRDKEESPFRHRHFYLEFNQLSESFNNMLKSVSEEKHRYRELLKNIDDAVYTIDEQGIVVDANESLGRQLGLAEQSVTNGPVTAFLPERDATYLRGRLSGRHPGEDNGITLETWHQRKDGSRMPVEINARAVTYGGQKRIVCVARDLSKRIEAEKALRESEEKYRSILENIEEGYFEIDSSGVFSFSNPTLCHIWGYSCDEIIGKPHAELATPESAATLSATLSRVRQSGRPSRINSYTLIEKDGTTKTLALSLSLMKDWKGEITGFRGVGRDVTEQLQVEEEKKLLEVQLQKGKRLEAIGTLAGGIAHDFNNILAAILGYTDLTLLETPQETTAHEFLQGIRSAAIRGKDLVGQILAFSRQSEGRRVPVKIALILKETLKMLETSFPPSIKVRQNISTRDAGTILADPTQMHQVLMNLCINARQAMERSGEGTLEVTLSKEQLDAKGVRSLPNLLPGHYLKLTVTDSGPGMSPKTMEHIFEPFFTTKKPGEGTGMGLAVVHGIIKNHDGEISVTSKEGHGTSFHLYFPLIEADVSPAEGSEPQYAKKFNNTRVLFVDDEEDLVRTGAKMLEFLGCTVTALTDSREALDIFLAGPSAFDMVITDQVMSGLTGEELAMEMLRVRPDIPVVLCTGFNEDITAEKALTLGIRKFMMKPLSLKDYSDTIQQLVPTNKTAPAP